MDNLQNMIPYSSLSLKLSSTETLYNLPPLVTPLEKTPFRDVSKEIFKKMNVIEIEQTKLFAAIIKDKASMDSLIELFKFWRSSVFPLLYDVGETINNRISIIKSEFHRQESTMKSLISSTTKTQHLKSRLEFISNHLSKLKSRMDTSLSDFILMNLKQNNRKSDLSASLEIEALVEYSTKYKGLSVKVENLRELLNIQVLFLLIF